MTQMVRDDGSNFIVDQGSKGLKIRDFRCKSLPGIDKWLNYGLDPQGQDRFEPYFDDFY